MKVLEWWNDPAAVPETRARWLARAGCEAIALVVAATVGYRTLKPLFTTPRPAALEGTETGPLAAGMPEELRREIFAEIAQAEPGARRNGESGFPGQPWSADDHRAAYERDYMRSIAARRSLNLTQVYLILDEGIRERWNGPDGKPLEGLIVPLVPRRH